MLLRYSFLVRWNQFTIWVKRSFILGQFTKKRWRGMSYFWGAGRFAKMNFMSWRILEYGIHVLRDFPRWRPCTEGFPMAASMYWGISQDGFHVMKISQNGFHVLRDFARWHPYTEGFPKMSSMNWRIPQDGVHVLRDSPRWLPCSG